MKELTDKRRSSCKALFLISKLICRQSGENNLNINIVNLCKINRCTCLRPATSLKKTLQYRCFPVNFSKFLRTDSFKVHLKSLHLFTVFPLISAGPQTSAAL